MCGICGIVDFDGRTVDAETIRRMADTLWHRGPDGAGYHFEPHVGLGHRRLSIIDIDNGQQPISNEDGTIWIVFNGEIYNYPELRSQLQSKGHIFRTNTDTEVIVHLYEEIGEDCFAQLRGMFALALWDRKRKRVVLARDRIGKKPLFYFHDHFRLVFGSELKAVSAGCNTGFNLDATAVADYFAFQYIPAPKSIYREVRKVPAAHYIVFSESGSRQQAYWDLSFANIEDRSEEEWCERLRQSVLKAVRVRLMSEVPLGGFLSGGLDSSAVVACMAQTMDGPPNSFTIDFEEEQYSEARHARVLANHVGANYHETTVRPNATEIVERLVWHYDEPFADSSAIPTYYVSKTAREQVTVALSGDGGDENFAGYKRYAREVEDNHLRAKVPLSFRRNVLAPLGRWYPAADGSSRILRGKSFLQRVGGDPLEGYLRRVASPQHIREALLSGDLKQELRDYDPLEQFREHYNRVDTEDSLSRIQYLDIKTYLTDDICVKVDRASMAVSLEVRAPLLDHRLMELAARIPSSFKFKNRVAKHIFKRAFSAMFPEGFLERRKQGFTVPIAEWFRGELREHAEAVLFVPDDLLNLKTLRRLWDCHQRHIQDYSAILWSAYMFRQWQARFMYGSSAAKAQMLSFTHV
jgi:asparagine synthase (glutamine-hydrolysing)